MDFRFERIAPVSRKASLPALITIVFFSGMLLFVFQNCGAGGEGFASIQSSEVPDVCTGSTCERDINTAIMRVGVTGILLDNGTYTPACNSANCFDLAGYCETGGYSGSVFVYQWTLAGGTPQNEVRTTEACDDNGRFHLQVHVPNGFTWSTTTHHTLKLTMKVFDETGAESVNPSGAGSWTYSVYARE